MLRSILRTDQYQYLRTAGNLRLWRLSQYYVDNMASPVGEAGSPVPSGRGGCHMIYLRGLMKVEVDENVHVDETYYCKTGSHNMCGGFECKCDCHRHVSVSVLTSSVCPSCNGSGRLPWVLPYLSRVCTLCNGSGKIVKEMEKKNIQDAERKNVR